MKWIVLAFVLFAAFIGTLVTLCIRQDINLVSKNYYDEELDYQHQIERLNNAQQLTAKPEISYEKNVGIRLHWAGEALEKGELRLFCPSNAKLDRHFDLSKSGDQVFPVEKTQHGRYRARLLWTSGGKEYFIEEQIVI